jgi:hypothetical protein
LEELDSFTDDSSFGGMDSSIQSTSSSMRESKTEPEINAGDILNNASLRSYFVEYLRTLDNPVPSNHIIFVESVQDFKQETNIAEDGLYMARRIIDGFLKADAQHPIGMLNLLTFEND